MKGFDVIELLKVIGLPGVAVIAWIYDVTTNGLAVPAETWLMILGLSILVTFITQWQLKSRSRVSSTAILHEDHKILADYIATQTHVLVAVEASLSGQLPLRGLLTLIPIVVSDFKWVFETTLRNALASSHATTLISEALMVRSLELAAYSRGADLVVLSPFFKSKSVMTDLRQAIQNIVQDVYTKLKDKHSELTATDLQYIWESVDMRLTAFGEVLLVGVQKELSDIDESLQHLSVGNGITPPPNAANG